MGCGALRGHRPEETPGTQAEDRAAGVQGADPELSRDLGHPWRWEPSGQSPRRAAGGAGPGPFLPLRGRWCLLCGASALPRPRPHPPVEDVHVARPCARHPPLLLWLPCWPLRRSSPAWRGPAGFLRNSPWGLGVSQACPPSQAADPACQCRSGRAGPQSVPRGQACGHGASASRQPGSWSEDCAGHVRVAVPVPTAAGPRVCPLQAGVVVKVMALEPEGVVLSLASCQL